MAEPNASQIEEPPAPVPPVQAPSRRKSRVSRRRTGDGDVVTVVGRRRFPWQRLPAWIGCLLFVGCLAGLLCIGPLPEWRSAGPAAARTGSGVIAVVIDPGHGGGDSGAVAQGVVEKDLNLDVGLRVADALQRRGIGTRLTRQTDCFIPLEGRVQIANALPGAIFVSIHFNDSPGGARAGRASGIETFYSETKEAPEAAAWMWASLFGAAVPAALDPRQAVRDGQALADSIQASLIAGTSAADRGTKERGLYVTRRVQGPAVLVEGGFISHPAEAKLLGDPAYRQRLAESIAAGIIRYLDAARARRPAAAAPAAAVRA